MAYQGHASGGHEIRREARNLFIYRFPAGPATAAHVRELASYEQLFWPDLDYIYNITILGDELTISPGTLSEAASLFRSSPPRTTAFVLRSFTLRTAMEFLTRMVRSLGLSLHVKFFEEEAAARSWIGEQRAKRMPHAFAEAGL